MPATLSDSVRGSILAGALGDAMGGPYEGQAGPLHYRPRFPWSISDDTQLTLATCESLVELGRISPEHLAGRFLEWYRAGRLSRLGASTLKALRDLDAGASWMLSGAQGEAAASNGAAMRIAPLAFLLDPDNPDDRQTLRDVCQITHRHDEAYAGALAVVAAMRCPDAGQILEDAVRRLPDSRVRDRLIELTRIPPDREVCDVAVQFGSSGYVVESVPLALYAARFIVQRPLVDVLRGAVEAGGDTDTIAAIAGQIAGARVGASQIPTEMIQLLPHYDDIVQRAERFARMVAGGG